MIRWSTSHKQEGDVTSETEETICNRQCCLNFFYVKHVSNPPAFEASPPSPGSGAIWWPCVAWVNYRVCYFGTVVRSCQARGHATDAEAKICWSFWAVFSYDFCWIYSWCLSYFMLDVRHFQPLASLICHVFFSSPQESGNSSSAGQLASTGWRFAGAGIRGYHGEMTMIYMKDPTVLILDHF